MAEVSLQGSCVVPSVSERITAGMPEHMRVGLEGQLGHLPARSIIRAKPAVVKGDPRSEVNTNGDFVSCSR
jgi:hypothetical protein